MRDGYLLAEGKGGEILIDCILIKCGKDLEGKGLQHVECKPDGGRPLVEADDRPRPFLKGANLPQTHAIASHRPATNARGTSICAAHRPDTKLLFWAPMVSLFEQEISCSRPLQRSPHSALIKAW